MEKPLTRGIHFLPHYCWSPVGRGGTSVLSFHLQIFFIFTLSVLFQGEEIPLYLIRCQVADRAIPTSGCEGSLPLKYPQLRILSLSAFSLSLCPSFLSLCLCLPLPLFPSSPHLARPATTLVRYVTVTRGWISEGDGEEGQVLA